MNSEVPKVPSSVLQSCVPLLVCYSFFFCLPAHVFYRKINKGSTLQRVLHFTSLSVFIVKTNEIPIELKNNLRKLPFYYTYLPFSKVKIYIFLLSLDKHSSPINQAWNVTFNYWMNYLLTAPRSPLRSPTSLPPSVMPNEAFKCFFHSCRQKSKYKIHKPPTQHTVENRGREHNNAT